MNCQRVRTFGRDGTPGWDAWVATDIQVPGTPNGMSHLPFLLVEGTHYLTFSTYKLVSFGEAEIDDSVFWPECFQQRFKTNN